MFFISLWNPSFWPISFSFFLKNFEISCKTDLLATSFLNFCLSESLYFSFIFEELFYRIQNSMLVDILSLNTLSILLLFLLACMVHSIIICWGLCEADDLIVVLSLDPGRKGPTLVLQGARCLWDQGNVPPRSRSQSGYSEAEFPVLTAPGPWSDAICLLGPL